MTHPSLLEQPTYGVTEASRLLRIAPSTLRWWLEGDKRDATTYEPVLRPAPTGSSDVTWGEFIEAGYLREYRRDLPLQKLRPLIESLRSEFGTQYPFATAQPLIGGRELVWNLQLKLDLPEELWIVVGRDQLVLGNAAASFLERVEFDPITTQARRFIVMKAVQPVVVDPQFAFALPTVRKVRTESLAELAVAGEPADVVTQIYSDYGITSTDIETAVAFEREYMQLAA